MVSYHSKVIESLNIYIFFGKEDKYYYLKHHVLDEWNSVLCFKGILFAFKYCYFNIKVIYATECFDKLKED